MNTIQLISKSGEAIETVSFMPTASALLEFLRIIQINSNPALDVELMSYRWIVYRTPLLPAIRYDIETRVFEAQEPDGSWNPNP